MYVYVYVYLYVYVYVYAYVYVYDQTHVITVPADVLAPHGAKQSVDTIRTTMVYMPVGDNESQGWHHSQWSTRSREITRLFECW